MKKANFIMSAIFGVLGLAIIIIAFGYPKASDYGTGVPGPGLWPIVISCVMLFCSGLLVLKSLKMQPEDDKPVVLWSVGSRRVYICMVILMVYTLLLKPIGFIIDTFALEFIFLQWFAKKKWYKTALISAVITMSVYCVFKFVLNVSMGFGLFYF